MVNYFPFEKSTLFMSWLMLVLSSNLWTNVDILPKTFLTMKRRSKSGEMLKWVWVIFTICTESTSPTAIGVSLDGKKKTRYWINSVKTSILIIRQMSSPRVTKAFQLYRWPSPWCFWSSSLLSLQHRISHFGMCERLSAGEIDDDWAFGVCLWVGLTLNPTLINWIRWSIITSVIAVLYSRTGRRFAAFEAFTFHQDHKKSS